MRPKFVLHDTLGTGAFGIVHSCSMEDDHGVVVEDGLAIKFLRENVLDDDEALRRFRSEGRILSRLKHPHIVRVISSSLQSDHPFFVMPQADRNLATEIAAKVRDRDWFLRIFGQVLTAVAHAHEEDVLHRDLKPNNVLLKGDTAWVSDFGMGKRLALDATQYSLTNAPVGTLWYMAPEMMEAPFDGGKPADVYSLGKMLWHLLVGRMPRPGPPALGYVSEPLLQKFIEQCCNDEPSLRYRDATEALEAWNALTPGLSPVQAPLREAEALRTEWCELPEGADLVVLRRLDALLDRNHLNEQLYLDFVPAISDQLIVQYAAALPVEFALLVERYFDYIDGRLPFSYCDEVASFCAEVFQNAAQDDVRKAALARMFKVGADHHRYPVADQVRKLLWGLKDDRLIALAAEVIESEPTATWYDHYLLRKQTLPEAISVAFKRAKSAAALAS